MKSKDEQKERISESFDRNGSCSSKSSVSDQVHVHFTTMVHVRNSSQALDHASIKSGSCNTSSNPSQESANPLVYHEQQREEAGVSPLMCGKQQTESGANPLVFHEQQREEAGVSPLMFGEQQREESDASPLVFHEQQREEAASPSESGCIQVQRMQWLLQQKVRPYSSGTMLILEVDVFFYQSTARGDPAVVDNIIKKKMK
jgi:hypothetical protein